RHRPEVRDRWRERVGPGSGIWYDLGPHLVDQALVLFGPPESVQADLQVQRRGAFAVDWFHVILGYRAARVILMSSMLAADVPTRFVVRGTRGSLTKRGGDRQEAELVEGRAPGAPGWGDDPDPVLLADDRGRRELAAPAGRYQSFYSAVRDAVHSGGEMPVTAAQATGLMAVLEAGIRSSAERRMVSPAFTDAERSAWPSAL
ncbi:MAG: Gfo/Idh/MocA family oxidoreductase, partial [Gemmatimonadales bacterium]